jgi:PST family polysaccharide transporter
MSDYNFEPHHQEMGRHIVSGVFNSGVVQTVKVLGQFVSVIVLSRLLSPSDFGLIAMIGPAYALVLLVMDLGLSQATIQKSAFNHADANTLFWINIGVGVVLAVFLAAVSPLVGMYYHEPRTVALTAAMGLLVVIGAAGNQHSAILMRRMKFGVMTINNVIGTTTGLVVSIVWALIFGGYWSLYAGMLVSNIISVVGIWIASGWRPSTPRLGANTRDLLKFGAGITSANIANFFAGNTDNVLIGQRWGDFPLGLYDRAYKLLLFPLQKIVGPVTGTLIPVLSRLTHDPMHYRAIYLKAVAQTALVTWPGIIWSVMLADTLVPVLLGKQWEGAAPIFKLLGIAGFLQVVNYFNGCLLISQGRSGEFARWSVINAITSVASFVIGLPYGPIGVAGAYAASEALRTPIFWYYITRRGPVRWMDIIRAVLPQTICALTVGAILSVYQALVAVSPILFLAGGLVLAYGLTALGMIFLPGGRETLKQSLRGAQKIFGMR